MAKTIDQSTTFPFITQSSENVWSVTKEARSKLEDIRGTKVRCISIVGECFCLQNFTHHKLYKNMTNILKENIELGSRICWGNCKVEMGLLSAVEGNLLQREFG